jgi:hypothetical protein
MTAVVDDEGRVRRRVVRVGEIRGGQIEVLTGLAAGERVLRRWADLASLEAEARRPSQ